MIRNASFRPCCPTPAKGLGVDEIVRRLPGPHLLDMVSQPNLPQEPESTPRAPRGAPHRWPLHPRPPATGGGPARRDAGSWSPTPWHYSPPSGCRRASGRRARMLAAMVDHQTAHEPDRRPKVERRRARWARKIGRRTAVYDLVQRRLGLELPGDPSEVEDDRKLLARLGLCSLIQKSKRRTQSGSGRRRAGFVAITSPLRAIRGLRPAVTGSARGAGDASADRGLLERQGMVLVGPDGLLLSGGAAGASQAQGQGGSPCSAIPSSSSRRVAASIEAMM